MRRIPMQQLIDFGTNLLTAKGLTRDDARYIAQIAVEAEAFGITTHGLVQFGATIGQLDGFEDGAPIAQPKVVTERGATALIDGEGVLGHLAMRLAKQLAVKKAREQGVAMIGVANTTWIAALAVYLIDLARDGFFAQIYVQSAQCQDCAPFGGIDPRFSTNPIALAFPTHSQPVVADFSTAAVAMGKVNQLRRQKRKAHAPLFMDNKGNLTDDPNVVRGKKGEAPGSILFTGQMETGHKGYALSLWCEAMTAMIGGSANNPEVPQRQSFTLTVIDGTAFADMAAYRKEMQRFAAWVKSSRTLPGFDGIRLPGERGFALLAQAQADGVPVDDATVTKLNELATGCGSDTLT